MTGRNSAFAACGKLGAVATHLFSKSDRRWLQKPLVRADGRDLPAELVILKRELRPGEAGAWVNSRGKRSGVVS
jgi:hypothetical protein